jgi:transposase
MSLIRPNRVEVVNSVQRRRRWTPEQKLEIVKQTNEPGSSVSLVARQHGLTAAQLFQWRKAYLEGSLVAVGANETVVPASELQEAMRGIKQLEGALGRKTLENEILKVAVDFAKAKSGLRARLYCPGTSSKGRVHCSEYFAQQRIDQESPLN